MNDRDRSFANFNMKNARKMRRLGVWIKILINHPWFGCGIDPKFEKCANNARADLEMRESKF